MFNHPDSYRNNCLPSAALPASGSMGIISARIIKAPLPGTLPGHCKCIADCLEFTNFDFFIFSEAARTFVLNAYF
jgi:hypothetical protein